MNASDFIHWRDGDDDMSAFITAFNNVMKIVKNNNLQKDFKIVVEQIKSYERFEECDRKRWSV